MCPRPLGSCLPRTIYGTFVSTIFAIPVPRFCWPTVFRWNRKRSGRDTVRSQQRWIFTGICNMPRKNNPPQPLSRTLWRPCCKTYRRFLHKKERGLPAFHWQTSWRRWRDSNSRAGFEPTYRISSADPSTAWVHLQIYVISLVPTRRPIQPVEIGKNNRIEQVTLFNLNSAGTRMVPRVSAVWYSA